MDVVPDLDSLDSTKNLQYKITLFTFFLESSLVFFIQQYWKGRIFYVIKENLQLRIR